MPSNRRMLATAVCAAPLPATHHADAIPLASVDALAGKSHPDAPPAPRGCQATSQPAIGRPLFVTLTVSMTGLCVRLFDVIAGS
ncbi:hypothetical protein X892_2848 [Burkholderia pseudomallei MSHR3960]|nr:hypothetical protein X892_2848 [Burkholderia pseudomallei MSHR3960]